jgi:hypothetical protein
MTSSDEDNTLNLVDGFMTTTFGPLVYRIELPIQYYNSNTYPSSKTEFKT